MTLSPFISLIVSRLRFLSSRGHRILVRASDRRCLFSTRARKGYQLAAYHGQSEGMYKRRIVVLIDVAEVNSFSLIKGGYLLDYGPLLQADAGTCEPFDEGLLFLSRSLRRRGGRDDGRHS